MALAFSAISSASTSTRDCAVDLNGALETAELLTTVTVTSSDAGLIVISSDTYNSAEIIVNGKSVAIKKAAIFRMTTQASSTSTQLIHVVFAGDSGSSGKYTINQPMLPALLN
jgi:hypothetical protein